MPQYLFVYHGGHTPTDPAEVEATMAAWGAWFQDIGGSLEIPGNPVGQSYTVSSGGVEDNGGANPASGFTVVKADSIEAATAMAKGCPMVVNGSGSVEVAEVHEIEM
ncbi:YciI family protein [Ruegeria conchae]|uniref:YciI family protein n=1 Tax=Ruegeria conchae TaxID=981384 RepID=UPI00148127A1|nr:YciI family protein [Ruegeria conchae]UWR02576.1 YciI family protein [Ruegeria conchae]